MSDRPTAQAPSTSDRDHDVSEIQEVFARLEAGFNQKDAALADQQFADDAVLVAPDGTMVRGWDDLFAYHTARLGGPANDWKTAYTLLRTTFVGPDVAVVHTRQDMTTADGEFANHGTFVLTRRNGAWWIGAAHNTNILTSADS